MANAQAVPFGDRRFAGPVVSFGAVVRLEPPQRSFGHVAIRHPEPVRPGAHVRVISPSWPALYHLPERARRALQVMRGLGLRVSLGEHARLITDDGVSAGSVEQRACDFMAAFTDPDVDVVFSAFGGESAHALLPLLDCRRLRGATKAFIGNSDNVWLNHFLYQEVGLTSFYGATYIAEMGEPGGPFPETLEYFRTAVMTDGDLVCRPMVRRSSEFRNWAIPE
jgi:muramoyltetrapeptide carboxypeptidase